MASEAYKQWSVVTASTGAFTMCFMVWMMFAVIGIPIKQSLGLNETEFGILVATPVLTGSLIRLPLGLWTDRFGGRIVFFILMLSTVIPIWMISWGTAFWHFLVTGLFVGVAGGSLADSSPSEDATLPQSDWAAAGLLSRGFCGGRAGVAGVAAAGRGAGSSPGFAADFAPRDSARLAQGSFFCSCSDIDEFRSGIVVRGLCRATEQNPAKCRTGMLLTTGRPAEYYKSRQRGSRRRLVSGNQRPAGAGGQHYGVGSRERARIMLPLSATSKSGR